MKHYGCVWQQISPNKWVFGKPVRGLVRKELATVVGTVGNFFWEVFPAEPPSMMGTARDLVDAVELAEHALGIES